MFSQKNNKIEMSKKVCHFGFVCERRKKTDLIFSEQKNTQKRQKSRI